VLRPLEGVLDTSAVKRIAEGKYLEQNAQQRLQFVGASDVYFVLGNSRFAVLAKFLMF